MIDIPTRFRALRGPYSYEYAARKAGVSAAHWFDWEKGKHKPTIRSAKKVADAYDVDLEWIFEGAGRGPKLPGSGEVADSPEKIGPKIHYRDIPIFAEGVPGGPGRIIEVLKMDLVNVEDWAKVPDFKLRRGHEYAMFRVVGDSMEPLIKRKDLILVNLSRRNPDELIGKPVLAWLGPHEGATVKILEEDADKKHWILRPTKEGYKERIVNKRTENFQVAAIEAAWLNF